MGSRTKKEKKKEFSDRKREKKRGKNIPVEVALSMAITESGEPDGMYVDSDGVVGERQTVYIENNV